MGHAVRCCGLQAFDQLKKDTTKTERLMLREFGFIAHVEHPHKFVLNYLVLLVGKDVRAEHKPLFQESWNLVNDRHAHSPLHAQSSARFCMHPGLRSDHVLQFLDMHGVCSRNTHVRYKPLLHGLTAN